MTGTGFCTVRLFRRLKDKTQVFLAPQGDHYRNRLTHTLGSFPDCQTIAKALRLNEDLVEALLWDMIWDILLLDMRGSMRSTRYIPAVLPTINRVSGWFRFWKKKEKD